ncbi:MAG: ARMT1-like domain-containing protein [Victivallaceae bacterium]|nr:ARMT1-like domain-containing protein [Victivallaceae bacterium]
MKMQLPCYACILKKLPELKVDDADAGMLVREYLHAILATPVEEAPPVYAGEFYRILRKKTGIDDPFCEEKQESTKFVKRLLPYLKERIARAQYPFMALVKLVAAGNIIDYGVNSDFTLDDAQRLLDHVFEMELDEAKVREFERELEKAERIFYILDNCGEAVFDSLLINRFRDKITLGVRGKAILNDVTRVELEMSGLGGIPVRDTGDGIPGVSLSRTNGEFLKTLEQSDLVISKGQGNFETLDEYRRSRIYFLLCVKCPVIADYAKTTMGTLLLEGRNQPL